MNVGIRPYATNVSARPALFASPRADDVELLQVVSRANARQMLGLITLPNILAAYGIVQEGEPES